MLNTPVTLGRNANGDYIIPLQFTWIGGGTVMPVPTLLTGYIAQLDTFDVTSIQKNINLPPFKSIYGSVNFFNQLSETGPFIIEIPSTNQVIILNGKYPAVLGWQILTFSLNIDALSLPIFKFYKMANSDGFLYGAANITLSTEKRDSVIGGM